MRKRFELIFALLVPLLVLGLVSKARGEKISEDLLSKLDQIKSHDYQSCLLIPMDKSDIGFAKQRLSNEDISPRLRHKLAIERLKQKAEISQCDLLPYLKEKNKEGSIREFRSFWIANAIFLRATKEEIKRIAQRSDVRIIYPNYPVTLIAPVSHPKLSLQASKDRSLSAVGIREVWKMGYTGKGRLVCSFDTGVEGTHPALFSNWRGRSGGSLSTSWLDPFHSSYPTDVKGHGTHVMGIMVGKADQETTGVAFDAQWICAAVVDRGKDFSSTISDILGAFEWAVDPDGNPGTIDDVPDVINNSWGVPLQMHSACDQTFWEAIDNVEAAGVVTIFAAGNEGPDPFTIRTPADRISTPLNSFSVGAVDANIFGYPVAEFSSRGPSGCDSTTVKPEVCAPGVNVNSTYVNGSYRLMSGSSMAAPFLSGAVAILREYNPDATVEQIKEALINSASDLGEPGEDNSYGWGLVNVKKALELLPAPSSPSVYLDSFHLEHQDCNHSADSANLYLTLGNLGTNIEDVSIALSSSDSLVQISNKICFIGDIVSGATVSNLLDPIVISYDSDLDEDYVAELVLNIFSDSPPYSKEIKLSMLVNDNRPLSTEDHDIANFELTFSNSGQYGLSDWSFDPMGGKGFTYPKAESENLYEGALILGTSSGQVSDAARNSTASTANRDFKPIPGQNLRIMTPGEISDQDGIAIFSDSSAFDPIGVKITQKTFCWADPSDDDYVILEYSLENISSGPIQGLHVGLFFDWDIPLSSPDDDRVGVDKSLGLVYQYDANDSLFLGATVISGSVKGIQPIDNSIWLYNGFTKEEKYKFVSGQYHFFPDTAAKDWSQIISAGPLLIPFGEKVKVAFAIVGARSLEELKENTSRSKVKYDQCATGIDDDYRVDSPSDFHLDQNYPNPFNLSTTIAFTINDERSTVNDPIHTTLAIYNVLGQRVKILLNEKKDPGYYEVVWDGKDKKGNDVSSGVYFYRIEAGKFSEVKKMVVLK